MSRNYSRLSSVEEKRNIRKAIQFGVLSIVIILLLIFFGVPLLAKFAGFMGDIRKSSTPIDKNDTTPPPPPRVSMLLEFTKEQNVDIKGSTEAGASVKLFFDSEEQEVVAGEDGQFIFVLKLSEGDNEFTLSSKDISGNESQQTPSYKIVFDNEQPDLTVSSPSDGASFFGSKQRQVTISGTTEPETTLTINDRPIAVTEDGKYVYTTTLNDGENKFWIKVTDKAENSTEKTINVTFAP